jgi:GNAT superfamily N-acetyltransferase
MAQILTVRLLNPDDAAAMLALRREALQASPLAFGSSVDDDRLKTAEAVGKQLGQQESSVVFGLFSEETLVGMLGLVHNTNTKERHKAYIWGMYVQSHVRGLGGGTLLLETAVEHARTWAGVLQIHLSVTEAAQAAHGLYRKAKFVPWGREPRALQWLPVHRSGNDIR